jgi:N-acetylglucosamine malate deacetylase 1
MNVLVIAPHPDDESIGCGGSIAIHARGGDRVTSVFLTSGETSHPHLPHEVVWGRREAEVENAARVLGIAESIFLRGVAIDRDPVLAGRLRTILEETKPELVYVPHEGESHPDHVVALGILRAALEGASIATPWVRRYEVWSPIAAPDDVASIDDVIALKLEAVRCHRSQLETFAYDRAVRGLNAYRGAMFAKSRYAEAFLGLDLSR